MSGQQRPRASDDLYAEVLHIECPECGVGVDEFCRNSRWETNQRARVPCHRRITAARQETPADTVIQAEEETER